MANLGSFGAAIRELDPEAEKDIFDFCGETFTVHGTIPGIIELTISAALAGKVSGVEGDAAMFEALRYALTIPATEKGGRPDRSQWDRFYRLAATEQASGDALTPLVLNIMGAQLGKDTVPRSTSSPGPQETSIDSNSSSSPSRDAPVFRRVDEVLGGSTNSPAG